MMITEKNKLLEHFGLSSYGEILIYMNENPEDEKVKEILELYEIYAREFEEEVPLNEQ